MIFYLFYKNGNKELLLLLLLCHHVYQLATLGTNQAETVEGQGMMSSFLEGESFTNFSAIIKAIKHHSQLFVNHWGF